MILFTDLHLEDDRLEDCIKFMRLVRREAKKKSLRVAHLGDLFEYRKQVSTRVLHALNNELDAFKRDGVGFESLVGNHDQYDKAGAIHALGLIDKHGKGFKSYGEPTYDKESGILFYPYSDEFDTSVDGWKTAKYLMCHHTFVGSKRNDNSASPSGIDPKIVAHFKQVFVGHFHSQHRVGKNIQYLGNPFHTSMHDCGQKKGYWLFEPKTGKFEFMSVDGFPEYFQVEIDADHQDDVDANEVGQDDVLKVKITGKPENVKLMRKKLEAKFPQAMIEADIKSAHLLRMDVKGEVSTLAERYVRHMNPKLDHSKLIEIGKELLNGA